MSAAEPASRSDLTRVAILDGALGVFARVGFEAASTRLIAEASGVHHASLRYHFSDKEQLWQAAIAEMFRRQRAEFSAAQKEQGIILSEVSGMKQFLRRYVAYCARHPEHAQILVHEAIADTPRMAWAIDTFIKPNILNTEKPFLELANAGKLRLDDPMLSSMILSAASQMIFVLAAHLNRVYDTDITSPAFVERVSDALITLLFIE